jgi:hypothetical protein
LPLQKEKERVLSAVANLVRSGCGATAPHRGAEPSMRLEPLSMLEPQRSLDCAKHTAPTVNCYIAIRCA